VASKGSSRNPLGKFRESKLAVLGVSVASLGVISGALALPHASGDDPAAAMERMPVVVETAAPVSSEPAPQKIIIRRVYVIRSQPEDSAAVEQWTEPAPAEAPAQSAPAQPVVSQSQPAPPPQPTPQPVTRSRGS
jgi:hypothetical protein